MFGEWAGKQVFLGKLQWFQHLKFIKTLYEYAYHNDSVCHWGKIILDLIQSAMQSSY